MRDPDFTRVKRLPEKASVDRGLMNQILDAGLVAHIGTVDHESPIVVPVAYARSNEQFLIHGSAASRLFKVLAAGSPACATVTILDGLVLARSLFESSMNYRSVMIFGTFTLLEGDSEIAALQTITEHLMPGRWNDARQPTLQELKATYTLAMNITEWSVKVGEGDPDDNPADLHTPQGRDLWAGVVPINYSYGDPIPDPQVPTSTLIPAYIRTWKAHNT